MVNESSFETGNFFVIAGSTTVLLEEVLFCLDGCGHPKDDVMPSSFPDSKSCTYIRALQ